MTPLAKKRSIDCARLGKNPAVGGEPRPLDREDEAVRRLVVPLGEALRLLRAIVGAVDLDRGQLAAGVFQLALLRQAFGIEGAAPRLIGPSADADQDARLGFVRHVRLLLGRRDAWAGL